MCVQTNSIISIQLKNNFYSAQKMKDGAIQKEKQIITIYIALLLD